MNNQIEWRRAFVRSGFNLIEADGKFDFNQENRGIHLFFLSLLSELPPVGDYRNGLFSPSQPTVDETAWLTVIDKLHTRSEGGRSGMSDIELPTWLASFAG